VWGEFGYPTARGQGWVGDPRTWELDVGAMSQALYFYQYPCLISLTLVSMAARRIEQRMSGGTRVIFYGMYMLAG
jgi:hypothetical protein